MVPLSWEASVRMAVNGTSAMKSTSEVNGASAMRSTNEVNGASVTRNTNQNGEVLMQK